MIIARAMLTVVMLFVTAGITLSQNTYVSWSSFDAGFGIPKGQNTAARSAFGQGFVGATQHVNVRVESGFLADSSLRGIITATRMDASMPLTFSLHHNYPNPFNPTTTIAYDLPFESDVTLRVFNVLGQHVASLVGERQSAGRHAVQWNAEGHSSGVYFYNLRTSTYSETMRLLLLR